ncbi:hypothetical protein [Rhizobium sp. NLR22b]|uniref:hypothetical protein n=1 Tax=Rhizobium sp. NLR22b TaxID=2731115 RepID=UPI001C82C309|nr:hypothetical protein [Rhizobium sp. NLR22b]MBX5242789.1 hypothetical protein [Rhizobium sp. NLR22b]
MTKVRQNDVKSTGVRTLQDLPSETLHNIIVHAVSDSDTWRAYKTHLSLSLTSRHLNKVTNATKAMRDYKENLDRDILMSKAVVEAYFPGDKFSGNDKRLFEYQTDAVSEIIRSLSPEKRSQVFRGIASAEDDKKRMEGYANIATQADFLTKEEAAKMDREALDNFKGHSVWPDNLNPAARVLAIRYHDIDSDARQQIRHVLFSDVNRQRRIEFSNAIIACKPSLLKEDFRLAEMVRTSIDDLFDPHGALAVIADHVDKKSPLGTDFVVRESLRFIGKPTEFGAEHGRNAPALAIARVIDGEIRPEYRDQIRTLTESDSVEGRALVAALSTVEKGKPREVPIEGGISGTTELFSELIISIDEPDIRTAVEGVSAVARSARRGTDAAREALMNTVRERDDWAR